MESCKWFIVGRDVLKLHLFYKWIGVDSHTFRISKMLTQWNAGSENGFPFNLQCNRNAKMAVCLCGSDRSDTVKNVFTIYRNTSRAHGQCLHSKESHECSKYILFFAQLIHRILMLSNLNVSHFKQKLYGFNVTHMRRIFVWRSAYVS